MLAALKDQAASTEAKVKVGVVIFNKEANVTPLTDLATGYETIENAIKQEIRSGTNTHAGLLAGKQMLDEDKEVAANRKYLIFVSDGITYMYNAEPTATAWSFKADSWKHWAGPDNWSSKYGSNTPPDSGRQSPQHEAMLSRACAALMSARHAELAQMEAELSACPNIFTMEQRKNGLLRTKLIRIMRTPLIRLCI